MVYCAKCGTALSPDARFCNKCGQAQPAPAAIQSGLSENAAATLSYLFGWITGIIVYLVDQRPYVRFHAAQSIVTFGGLHILRSIVGVMFGMGWVFGPPFMFGHWHSPAYGLGILLLIAIGFVCFVLWIVCMVKAWQGERWMVPFAGDIAVNLAAK